MVENVVARHIEHLHLDVVRLEARDVVAALNVTGQRGGALVAGIKTQNFQNAIRMNVAADTLLAMMTDTSEYWIDSLEQHARTYTAENLDTCQFYEVYAILLYRLYEREHLFAGPDDKMVYLLLSKSGMVDRLTRLKLGPMEVKNDRGSIGLATSPKVPIMIFEWDDSVWKLNLPQTLPLITKGIESIAVKKSWSNKKLAMYWLDKEYHQSYSRLDDSLYEPIY